MRLYVIDNKKTNMSKLCIKPDAERLNIFNSTEPWENCPGVIWTRYELIDALFEMPYNDPFFARFKEKELARKKEQYRQLQPIWFKYAPKSAQKKRKELENAEDLEKMEWLKSIISYNSDKTINILPVNKTFCKDISRKGQRYNWLKAEELAESEWYELGSDYNDSDSLNVKESSDWYTVINVFSKGNWDTVEGRDWFRDMTWCHDRYWTSTKHKNEKWKESADLVCNRIFNKFNCIRYYKSINLKNLVCGFKPYS